MIKKAIKWTISLTLISLIVLTIYIFNSEKLLTEYWFQKRIDDFSYIEPFDNLVLTNPTLTYNCYDNSGIDLEISVRKNGLVSISRFTWNSENDKKTYYFKTDSTVTEKLFYDFNQIYTDSKIASVDDHISARYYRLVEKDTSKKEDMEIGFYNVQPDKIFKSLKNRFLTIGNRVIKDLDE